MQKKSSLLLALAPALLSLVLALGVMSVFSACGMKDDGTWMRCHTTQHAVAICAGIMAVVLAAAAFVKNRMGRAVLYLAGVAGSVVAFLLPGTIMPMCMMQTMRCYSIMQPFVRILSVIVALLCLVLGLRALRTNERGGQAQ